MEQYTKITALMSVYNTDSSYLREAIDSVLNQSYNDFEFILINDCSNDDTTAILRDYSQKDKRIVLIENKNNLGLTKSLNIGLSKAKGEYIARIDSDDACDPRRFERQLEFMEKNRHVTVLGCKVHDDKGISHMSVHISWEWRKVQLITSNCGLVHSSAFIRNDFLKSHNIVYDETKKRSQDYKLWTDITMAGGRIEILDEDLVFFRKHDNSISVRYIEEQDNAAVMISAEQISNLLMDISADEIYELMMNVKSNTHDRALFKDMLKKASLNYDSTPVKYNQRLLLYELMYLYNKYVGKQKWQSIGYWWYRTWRAVYKHI